MLGANKSVSIQRLNADKTAYEDLYLDIKVRWSAMKMLRPEWYSTKAKQIAYKMVSDLMDLRSSDRVVFPNPETQEDEIFVIAGAGQNTDTLGKHVTSLIRQIESPVHSTITWMQPSTAQANYDPIFEEFVAEGQSFDDSTIIVLLDPIEAAKNAFIKYIDAGKLEDIDYVMTVDFPDVVTNKDKFVFDNILYEVKWILPEPFQTLVGLKKSIINYVKETGDGV